MACALTGSLALSPAPQIRRLERRKHWLVRAGFLSLLALFALFSHVPMHSTAVAALAVAVTISPPTAAVLYAFLVIDGRIHRLRMQALRRREPPAAPPAGALTARPL